MPKHTSKKPTGPYNRKGLLDHLEDEAKKSTVGNDYTPFVKKPPKENKSKVAFANLLYFFL